ncbi:hypothetical protein HHK36_012014 [Tetracentron sinense]|uniref:Uncharacterized protein n=1 Tax=Tetracentron sinense TaxID=13715 RepID=A0A835DGV3_TETSI|nr:hypothetical protein HHK36_012014 [Tetracentron sinense]
MTSQTEKLMARDSRSGSLPPCPRMMEREIVWWGATNKSMREEASNARSMVGGGGENVRRMEECSEPATLGIADCIRSMLENVKRLQAISKQQGQLLEKLSNMLTVGSPNYIGEEQN